MASLTDDNRTLYEILDVPAGSGDVMVRRAYRRLSFKYHPDTQEQGLSDEKKAEYEIELLKIQEAYEVLSNPELKAAYDALSTVLKEQEEVSWDDPYQTGWNLGSTNPSPYMPFTSGSAFSTGPAQWWASSGSIYTPKVKTTFNIRINDAIALGLTGLVAGQIVHVSYSMVGSPYQVSMNAQQGINTMACKIISVHYGTAPGIPVYADFELEEL